MGAFDWACKLITRLWRFAWHRPATHTLDCRDVMRQLWEFLDGELPPDEHRALSQHLAACARCNPHYRFQFHFLAAVVHAHAEPRPAPSADFTRRVRVALDAAGPSSS